MKNVTSGETSLPVAKSFNWKAYFKRYWQLYLLLLLPMAYLLVFKYIPMKYVLIAFKKYSLVQSLGEMPWADNHGFQYFIQAFHNKDFLNALKNARLVASERNSLTSVIFSTVSTSPINTFFFSIENM